MSATALIRGFCATAAFAWRDGRAIPAQAFIQDALALAALLPDRRHVINLCADRYRFTVGFAAALLRRQITLLPPSETPDVIARVVEGYPDVYCLTDRQGASRRASLETVYFPALSVVPQPPVPVPSLPDEQVAAVVFTSGSTGQPVPYAKTWGNLARVARAEFDDLELRSQTGIALLATVPQQHVYGLESTVMLAMQGGIATHARRPFYPADICSDLASMPRPRGMVTSPVHLRVLLAESSALPPADFLLCATAPLAPQLAAEAEARFGAPLYEIYGCTEAGAVASRRTVKTAEWRTLADVRLRADGKGTWVEGGHVSAPVLLADVIELRGRGRFLLHGRTSDLVNIAGKRTSLAYLNYHLNSIEGVRDGAFAVPEGGEAGVTRLMAFVVAPGLTSEDVMRALRERIDAAFLPRPLRLVEALPRNATGKLPRQELDELARKAG